MKARLEHRGEGYLLNINLTPEEVAMFTDGCQVNLVLDEPFQDLRGLVGADDGMHSPDLVRALVRVPLQPEPDQE